MKTDDGVRQAAAFYHKFRIENQRSYYEGRAEEYEKASGQLSGITTFLLMLAAAAGVLGAAEVWISRAGWGIVASVCSALVAALAGWGMLIGFEENAPLYRGATAALRRLGRPLRGHRTDRSVLLSAVAHVEEVLQSETGQWGQQLTGSAAQLASQLQLATSSDAATDQGSQPPAGQPGPDTR